MMSYCPLCGSRDTGRISRERYFCRECCHEWARDNGEVIIYEIAADGTAVRVKAITVRALSREGLAQRRAG